LISDDRGVTNVHHRRLASLAGPATQDRPGLDVLCLVPVPLVPEIRLFLAEDAIILWARMEAEAGTTLSPPFWASAWLGGQALARFVLDHPGVVKGRRVLDLAAGSGLVGIAASMAGAATVTANDIDQYAMAAVELNARINSVDIAVTGEDLLDGDGGDVDVVLAGDVLYSRPMAQAVLGFVGRASARGAEVLIADPGRADLPGDQLEVIATYSTDGAAELADSEIENVYVLRPR
jgi:predicted nicotinamide N-methyase